MNVYDSARMADVLAPHGYEPGDTPDGADLIILNTCHIREKATEKVYSELGRLRAIKDEAARQRSEEHTSELQSLMRISYAVFCLKKKNKKAENENTYTC